MGRYRRLERGRSSAGLQGVSRQLQADRRADTVRRPIPRPWAARCANPAARPEPLDITDGARARAFFEEHFLPLRISRLGEDEGFVTGYYEPVIDGSRTQTDVYNVPVYRRPSNLFVRGFKQDAVGLPNKGEVFRKIGRRKLVPYYDRAEIEDGAIAGRGLEICWLKNQTDLLFAQIQGSARVRLEDGSTIRINYDAHNGYPYTAVGRILIDRGIIPKEQMSMQQIREWMDQNPDGAKEVRRQNRAYVFFREVQLSDKDEAVGAQGVPLTPGRSIAVDKALHVYGTPFFIEGELPIELEQSKTPFRRLMIAQDTGSAITGPARADSISAPVPMPGGCPAGSGTICVSSCWCRRASIRWRGAARCRCRIRGHRRKSQSCFRRRSAEGSAEGPEDQLEAVGCCAATTAAAVFAAASGAQTAPARSRCRCRRRGRTSNRSARGVAIAVIIVIIAATDETSALDPGIADSAAPQAQPERRRARAVGERRQADKAAAQKASRAKAGGCRAQAEAPRCEIRDVAETAFRPPKSRGRQNPSATGRAAAGAARTPRTLAIVARPQGNRRPARPARNDADPRPPRAVGFFAPRPQRRPDLRACHHRQGQRSGRNPNAACCAARCRNG